MQLAKLWFFSNFCNSYLSLVKIYGAHYYVSSEYFAHCLPKIFDQTRESYGNLKNVTFLIAHYLFLYFNATDEQRERGGVCL